VESIKIPYDRAYVLPFAVTELTTHSWSVIKCTVIAYYIGNFLNNYFLYISLGIIFSFYVYISPYLIQKISIVAPCSSSRSIEIVVIAILKLVIGVFDRVMTDLNLLVNSTFEAKRDKSFRLLHSIPATTHKRTLKLLQLIQMLAQVGQLAKKGNCVEHIWIVLFK
jgi:hypothetical protein